MSEKKNGGNAALKNTLRKVLPAILVIAVVLIGYYFGNMKDSGKDELNVYEEATETQAVTEQTDAPDAETTADIVFTWEDMPTDEDEEEEVVTSPEIVVSTETSYDYYLTFYNDKLLDQHYDKHGRDMGFDSPEAYERAANEVIFNEETLHKTEKEDGDDVYYLEETNEFVVVSTSGYIRTYFLPDDGMAYFNRQ